MSTRVWRWLRLVLGLALILALVPILLTPEFWSTLAGVNVPLVIVATLFSAASVISKAWRWGAVMRWRGIPLSAGYLVSSYFISVFFNNFLPSGMGGDVVRAYETARDTGQRAASVIGVVIERGSGMLSLFAAGSLGALFVPGIPTSIVLLAHGLFIGSLIGIAVLWSDAAANLLTRLAQILPTRLRSVWDKVLRLHDEFRAYRHEWRLFVTVMAQSVVTLITTLMSVYALLLAFDQHVAFGAFAAVFAIVTAIDVIPLSLNGLGIREGSYVYFLGLLGVATESALGIALLVRLIVTLLALIGGVAFLWRSSRH